MQTSERSDDVSPLSINSGRLGTRVLRVAPSRTGRSCVRAVRRTPCIDY